MGDGIVSVVCLFCLTLPVWLPSLFFNILYKFLSQLKELLAILFAKSYILDPFVIILSKRVVTTTKFIQYHRNHFVLLLVFNIDIKVFKIGFYQGIFLQWRHLIEQFVNSYTEKVPLLFFVRVKKAFSFDKVLGS